MSAFTDQLYRQWLDGRADGGEHIPCERATWRSKRAQGAPQKAERQIPCPDPGAPIHDSLKKAKNHGISKF